MEEPPVGAPSELANKDEMPGCITGIFIWIAGAPILLGFLVKEVITFPLDVVLFLYDKFRRNDD